MWDAYLGIVTPRGLEALYRDERHTSRFLLRRRFRWPSHCVWFVLPPAVVPDVQSLLRLGRRAEALELLYGCAREMGTMLPETAEERG